MSNVPKGVPLGAKGAISIAQRPFYSTSCVNHQRQALVKFQI